MKLTLIVPGMGRALASNAPHAPQLAQLAARGSLRHAWDRSELAHGALHAWQRGLLWTLQLEPAAHPSAALSALAAGHVVAGAQWLHADPVHLAASLNHLSLVELTGELQPTSQQLAACEPQLRQHLQACGWQLHALASGNWLVQTAAKLQLVTVCPAAAAANDLQRALPQGADGVALRRLVTELQMLLHEHPANQQRARAGLPELNSLWLWGNGSLESVAPRPLPVAFGDVAYLHGVYRHYGASVQPLPVSGVALLAALPLVPQAVAVLAPPSSAEVSPDDFEQRWLAPLVQGLRTRRLERLELVLDGWHLGIDRRGLRRFWRRPLPPHAWDAVSNL